MLTWHADVDADVAAGQREVDAGGADGDPVFGRLLRRPGPVFVRGHLRTLGAGGWARGR